MYVLSKNTHKQVTTVIHIADIHVRTGNRVSSRVDEYRHVFQNFLWEIGSLKAVRDGTALLVIAGDVFHHKGRLETEGAVLIYEWLNQLLVMLPVLLICGNHDFRQEDPAYKDMIEMLVAPYEKGGYKYPIHYLRETGHYIWENIGFGITSVKDTLQAYNTCGILADLPRFPDPSLLAGVDCRVALFHGSISQSALPSGKQVSEFMSGYPLEWFAGYDIAMLGDNHTQQLNRGLQDTLAWGYPGSLVQQDAGEPLVGHGYILWNIPERSGTLHHVRNDYGTLNIFRSKEDGLMVRLKPYHAVPLKTAMSIEDFPKFPQVRVIGVQGDDTIVEQELRVVNVTASRVFLTKCVAKQPGVMDEEEPEKESMAQLIDLNRPDIWRNFVVQSAPELGSEVLEWLYDPCKLLLPREGIPEAIHEKVAGKNRAIQQAIDQYDEKANGPRPPRFDIVFQHMQWEYLMCYGEENWFDFGRMEGKVALLNGKNASGKSSFIDVMCLAIFGEPTTMRSDIHGSKMSVKVIHDKKPTTSKHDSAYVKLLFTVNGELYEIKRSFTVKQKDEVLQSKVNKIATVHRVEDNVLVLVAEGTTMVNEWVAERFGSLPEILMSTIMCQLDTSNFFLQKEEDQVHIIEKALHMETIQRYECILHEALKAHKYVLNELTTYLRGINDSTRAEGISFEELERTLQQVEGLKGEKDAHEARRSELSRVGEGLLLKIRGEVDTYGYDLAEAEAGFEMERGNADRYPDLTPEILRQAHDTRARLEEQEGMLVGAPRSDEAWETVREDLSKLEQLLERHLKKRPQEPQLTEAYIQKKEAEYHTWLHTIKYMEIDLEGLNGTIAGLMAHQQELYKEQSALQKEVRTIPRPKSKQAEWQKEWDEWAAFTDGVWDMTVSELEKQAEVIRNYLQKIQDARAEYGDALEKVKDLEAECETYKDIEFNPKCTACQRNPLHKRLETIRKQLDQEKSRKKKAQKRLKSMEATEQEYKNELEEIEEAIPDRVRYELQAERMEREKREWDASAEMWEQEEEHGRKVAALQEGLRAIFQELQGLQKIKTEQDVWTKENARIEKEREVIREWSEWNQVYEELCEKKRLHDNTLAWAKIQALKRENEELFQRIEQYEDAVKERDEWANIVRSIQWLDNRKELEAVAEKCHHLQSEIIALETRTKGALEKMRMAQACEAALKSVQEKYGLLQEFANVFVGEKGNRARCGFKAWVYNTEIIPLMEREVNHFIEPLDTIRLRIQYHNNALLYSLEDRGNCPTLDHASGYQRFLIGIAMRIALARIGAVGQNVRHLIIDEGFVACDSTNLLKVDAILKSMMEIGNYKSVLLMSHLDAIRDIAELQIHIARSEDDVFSRIAWGSAYPTFDKYKKSEVQKEAGKKGRSTLKKIK